MTDIDLEDTNKRLMAALRGIAEGKRLSDSVPVQPYGRTTKIFEALKDAGEHLKEPFHADHLEIVDQAFEKLGLVRGSGQKNEVAKAILEARP
jgi:hypothetical protein